MNAAGLGYLNNPGVQQTTVLTGQLDLRTATAGQLQDAARRRHGELTEKRAKLLAEAQAMANEIDALAEMLGEGKAAT